MRKLRKLVWWGGWCEKRVIDDIEEVNKLRMGGTMRE